MPRIPASLVAVALLALVACAAGLCLLAAFGGHHGGEMAAALGGLVGGAVGAVGAILAVFLTLSRQRQEETANVTAAVTTEVTTLTKYVIGSIEVCQQIKSGTLKIPRQDAKHIVNSLIADPVIYPAIADRVGLLPHPNATTEFYLRISEAKAMAMALSNKTDADGMSHVTSPVQLVTGEFATSLADCLITALQLARHIVADVGSEEAEKLAAQVRNTVATQIDECLATARNTFLDALSFQTPG